MTPVQALTGAFATYRLTKLVLDDEVTRELREKAFELLDRYPNSRVSQKLSYFLTCPWCVSIWAAAALLIIRRLDEETYDAISQTLGMSAVTGLLFTHAE